jgi:dipeptidyl-peptidase-3
MYGPAIQRIIGWLEKAAGVAENQAQADALQLLIDYYRTGDLKTWDAYNIAWTSATDGDIDYINSFIEVYNDPMGYRGSFESIVQVKDFDASERMAVVMDNVQWFEDNAPLMPEHKKEKVVGVTYKVVNVAGESGDASPSTPIGVNLPNANWIRANHGSKSVSLGNIVEAYAGSSGTGYTDEFALTEEEKARAKEHGKLAGKLHTALHEVVGHASGKLNEGVGTPKETLKNYASTLEEGRADLVALYYIMDPKLVELGLMPSLEVGKAEYDGYIRNGLMVQLRRIEPGEVVEEAHMRNRQLVAAWAYEKGQPENVIEKVVQDGKTYFRVNDYEKLRVLFGELLREIQRIKSEGDYEAGRALVENYGVQVDQALHQEVLERSEALGIAPYGGFINPRLVPVEENGEITDIKVEYPTDFAGQMLEYSATYGNL